MSRHKLEINHKVRVPGRQLPVNVVRRACRRSEERQVFMRLHQEFISSSLKWHFNDAVHQSVLMAG